MTKKKESHVLSKADEEAVEELKQEAAQEKEQEAIAEEADQTVDTPQDEISPDDQVKDEESAELSQVESAELDNPADQDGVDPEHPVTYTRKVAPTAWWQKPKWIAAIVASSLIVVAVLLLLIPTVRYVILGTFFHWNRDVTITLNDNVTHKPLNSTSVMVDGQTKTTGASGAVTFSLPLGQYRVVAQKSNYADADIAVTLDLFSQTSYSTMMMATGKQITLTVADRVTGAPVEGVSLAENGVQVAKTDAHGVLQVIIPLDKKQVAATLTAADYQKTDVTLAVDTTSETLVPNGSVYYLSKASGKLDVVKASLDGSDASTVVAGTGAEDDKSTYLLATRDWTKLILVAKREASKLASLYAIDTASGKMVQIDQSGAVLTPVGWSGHTFVYRSVAAATGGSQAAGSITLKAYNADNTKTTTLDQNTSLASGTQQNVAWEVIENPIITTQGIFYTKRWQTLGSDTTPLAGKKATVILIQPDGTGQKTLASYDAPMLTSFMAKLYQPQNIDLDRSTNTSGKTTDQFSQLVAGAYTELSTPLANFASAQFPVFIASPDGNQTLWTVQENSASTIYSGDQNGGNKQQVVTGSQYVPYGWLNKTMILLKDANNTLYVTTVDQLKANAAPLKIGSYSAPATPINGYGYGGL